MDAYSAETAKLVRSTTKLSAAVDTLGKRFDLLLQEVKNARAAATHAREELSRHRRIHKC